MSVEFVKPAKRSGNTKAKPLRVSLDQPGRLRVGHWLTLLDISAPLFYRRLHAGQVPKPDGRDPRPYWNTETVRAYLAGGKP